MVEDPMGGLFWVAPVPTPCIIQQKPEKQQYNWLEVTLCSLILSANSVAAKPLGSLVWKYSINPSFPYEVRGELLAKPTGINLNDVMV